MKTSESAYGRLYVVASPIGNWDDMSPRAIEVLSSAALVAAEDTRYARRLFSHFDISAKVISCHQGNELARSRQVIHHLERGENVALVSDAGTPGISDPGAALVAAVSDAGFAVSPVPGPSSIAAALSVSGLCTGGYHFIGFLPRSKSKREAALSSLKKSPLPIAVFESPRRMLKTLEDVSRVLGDRHAVLCRELTKTHEELFRGTLSEIAGALPARPLGEMVLVISGADSASQAGDSAEGPFDREEVMKEVERLIGLGMSKSAAARETAKKLGLRKNAVYDLARNMQSEAPPEIPRKVSFTIKGHPVLRATHDKTIEFKKEASLSERETCVVGVGADWDPVLIKRLSGRVRIVIEAGDMSESFEAKICPRFGSPGRMVVRKSRHPSEVTLAVAADIGANDLDRDMIRFLKDENNSATVTIEPLE